MYKFSFIGSGNMAEALIKGLLQQSGMQPRDILCCDTNAQRLQLLQERYGDLATSTAALDAVQAQVVILSVKPPHIGAVTAEIAQEASPANLIVSVAAGIPLSYLERQLPGAKIIRAMPNTAALVGAGVTGYTPNTQVTAVERQQIQEFFSGVGLACELPEPQLDVVTALSGGGPAYLCLVAEALSDAGVRLGLPRAAASSLAAQVLVGTGKMIQSSAEHPAVLRENVCSPGGTTIEGVAVLEEHAVRGAFMQAVEAAHTKAQQLGELYESHDR